MERKKTNNYIDNAKFTEEMKKHRVKVLEAKAEGLDPRIPVSAYIGLCFYNIASRLSLRPNFIGYSYRDEMVSDALETMLSNAHHFDPNAQTRSGTPNAFSYFTRIAWQAMVHRINREKKQEYVKYKVTQNQVIFGGGMESGSDDKRDSRYDLDIDSDYYQKLAEKYDKPNKKDKPKGLEKLVDD